MDEIKRDTSHDNRKFEDHKSKEFEIKQGKDTWTGAEVEVKSDPLIDTGTGKPYILRTFEFSKNPDPRVKLPRKQEIFNSHLKQIKDFLWKDGLKALEDIAPRVLISKDKKWYRICVVAEPRLGVSLADNTRTLQQLISNK